MKVKELIEELKKADQELEAHVSFEFDYGALYTGVVNNIQKVSFGDGPVVLIIEHAITEV